MQIIEGLDNDHTAELRDCLESAHKHLNRACQLLCEAEQNRQREKELCRHAAEACDQTMNAIGALGICQRWYEEMAEELRAGV